MLEPTDRQAVALRFIDEHVRVVGCPPTLREIGDHMCIRSTNGVNDHVAALESKGYLERREPVPPSKVRPSRAIRLTDKGREYLASKATT